MVDQDKLTDGEMLLEASSEGYLSKNKQLRLGLQAEGLINDRNRFLKDTSVVSNSADQYLNVLSKTNLSYSKTFYSKLMKLILKAKEQELQIIYILPPRCSANTYDFILPVF